MAFLNILLGGFLTILGGVVGIHLNARYARKTRIEEKIAELKVETVSEAYARLKKIGSTLLQLSASQAKQQLQDFEEWFWTRRLFFPGRFATYWVKLRSQIWSLAIFDEGKMRSEVDKAEKHWQEAQNLIVDALKEIYKEMNIEPIEGEFDLAEPREKK